MQLYVRSCPHCQRIRVREKGSEVWKQWDKPGTVVDIAQKHKVLMYELQNCSDCIEVMLRTIHNVAANAGSIT